MEIKSGSSHIAILRSTVAFGQHGMTISFLGEQRPLSDSEFIEKVRAEEKHSMSHGLSQQYLINDFGAVFLITNENGEKGYKVTLTFPGM